MRILAIDPGGTTGIASADFSEGLISELYTDMPEGFEKACHRIDTLTQPWPYKSDVDLVVIERFTINERTIKSSRAGSNMAVEIIGVARYLAISRGIPFEEQQPADAKNFADDKKLRRIGWYTPGPDHARDATRHLLLAAVRHKQLDLGQLLPQT